MFAERMKELREFTEPRLKQEELGKILNMSQRKISRLETGAVNPTPEEIVQICKFYKVSADYILGITNDINKNKEK